MNTAGGVCEQWFQTHSLETRYREMSDSEKTFTLLASLASCTVRTQEQLACTLHGLWRTKSRTTEG